MNRSQGVHSFFEGEKEVAKIDNTDMNDIKVILIDTEEKYIQRFFINKEFKDIVSNCKIMRKVGIPSL